MLRHKTILKLKTTFLILLSVGLVLATVGVFFRPVRAQTWVEGHITQDTTWTVAGSPYRAINDVIVDPGVLLTVEPGVEVQFADGFSLIVGGSLTAVGTDGNPIVFTSSRVSPSPGAWNTIKFEGNSSEQLLLKHMQVEYAVHGVTVESLGLATIEKSELAKCSASGIQLVGENNVIIKENDIEQNWNGIASETGNPGNGAIVINNTISNNEENGIKLRTEWGRTSPIHALLFLFNNVLSNGVDGIQVWSGTNDIYNVSFSSNIISLNGRAGIHFYAYDSHFAQIYNVSFSNNTISSNGDTGIYVRGKRGEFPFDLTMWGNIISANTQKGIWLQDGINVNLTRNSICHNMYGVVYSRTTENLAQYNNIYHNSYGMNVTNGATVNAEHNYWGHSTGPYHASLNPEGEGNPVNGDGTDLDFIPFANTPFRPILYVSITLSSMTVKSESQVSVSVHVTNGTVPIKDAIVQLTSDTGGNLVPSSGNTNSDGDFSSTFTAPSVSDQTTLKITATASKSGYVDGSDRKYLTVLPPGAPELSVQVTADPNSIKPGETSTIMIKITDKTDPVEGATLALSCSIGSLSLESGTTNSSGYFTCTFTAPSVTSQTTCTITADATKTGYLSDQGQTHITVKPLRDEEEGIELLWILLAVVVVSVVIIAAVLIARRRRTEEPSPTQ